MKHHVSFKWSYDIYCFPKAIVNVERQMLYSRIQLFEAEQKATGFRAFRNFDLKSPLRPNSMQKRRKEENGEEKKIN